MKSNKQRIGIVLTAVSIAATFLSDNRTFAQVAFERIIMQGGSSDEAGNADDMPDDMVREIQEEMRTNIEQLRVEGKLPAASSSVPPLFIWPMKRASGLRIFHLGAVINYVDHNPAYPDHLLDWNCGTRTYDGGIQQNHMGTDIVSQPFPWKRLQDNEAYAVAAAPGVITIKRDGYFDRNCMVGDPNWNLIILTHSDGSVTWYGHLKNGGLTHKKIGDSVETGEFLGVVGSSGSSRIPHIHFQVYNAENQLQDPYLGPCNSMNSFSWWHQQEPYRNSQILALTTGSVSPEFPACPVVENPNERIVFQPLDQLVTTSYYRDQVLGQETVHSVLQPDGTAFANWIHVSPASYNLMRYWFRTWILPADAPLGRWTYRAVYNGETYETYFYVGQPPNVSASGRITTLSGGAVAGARIVLTGSGGGARQSRSNPFGYFSVDDLVVGETYQVSVEAKGLTFLPRSVIVGGQISEFDHFSLNDN